VLGDADETGGLVETVVTLAQRRFIDRIPRDFLDRMRERVGRQFADLGFVITEFD
jgi:hypothetical protein